MDFEEGGEDLFIGEEEEGAQFEAAPQKDEVILLIDSSLSMHKVHQNGEISFFMVIQAALGFLKNKILSSESDNIGIVLYNTHQSSNHMNFKGLFEFQKLAPPDAPRIKELQMIINQKQDHWGHNESLFVEALWLCHDILAQNKSTANRRILIFTDDDRPNANRPNDLQRAIQRAKDLANQDIVLELFPLNKVDKAFDFKNFYSQIIPVDEDNPEEIVVGSEKLEDLVFKMHTKEYKKRKLGTINFALCPETSIAVSYFCLLREMKKPFPTKVHLKDNKKLKSVTSWICQESGKQLWAHEIGTHFELGGTKVKFSKEDVSHIKAFDVPGLKLMGFKDRNRLKNYMNIRASYFIYPEDSRIKGSSSVFHALWVSMKKLNKMAIVRMLSRQGAVVRFAALIPNDDPQGFNAIFLPYADDMRNPEILRGKEEVQAAPDELVNNAAAMIGNIQLGEFNVNSYYNPVLQHFYTNLEAMALEEPRPDEVLDSLKPDEEGLRKKKPYIEKFWESAYEGTGKRQVKDNTNNKKTKYTEAELKKLKVNELKDVCDQLRINKTGRKDELIERILAKG